MNTIQTFAIVTPTYRPDLTRCDLLCRSLDRCAPDIPHYLIVDRRDQNIFSYLASRRRHVIVSEDLIGNKFWRTPGTKGYWLSLQAPPVRGWIVQQILKIAAVGVIPEDVLVFCDSDTAFFRPFSMRNLLIDGRIGLLDIPYASDSTHRWIERSKKLLGVQNLSAERSYVGNMICWQREIILAMQSRVSEASGNEWDVAIARGTSFSEYMLYGAFVRDVIGYENTNHAPSDVPLVKPSWDMKLNSESSIEAFFADFNPSTVAVMIHSKGGIEPKQFERFLERLWTRE